MSNLFSQKNLKNKVHRDGFDLGRKVCFSAKLGELLPVYVEDCFPGDTFKINLDWFTRTIPATSPAYTRFAEYYDFFFVPYHLMWRYFPQMVVNTKNDDWASGLTNQPNVFTEHPYFNSKEALTAINDECIRTSITKGYNSGCDSIKLWETLGYGNLRKSKQTVGSQLRYKLDPTQLNESLAMNPFPFAAYQKIYNDFYRNSQWEDPIAGAFNFDYLNQSQNLKIPIGTSSVNKSFVVNDGLFKLRRVNYNKDYFMGVLPKKQYGVEAIAAPLVNPDGSLPQFNAAYLYAAPSSGGSSTINFGFMKGKSASNDDLTPGNAARALNAAGISALAIRKAEYLQKYKEITNSGRTDYQSQVEKHFNVKPSDDSSHRCTYIGGTSKRFGLDEVTNTNLNTQESSAYMFGKGVNGGSSRDNELTFHVTEHGIFMCVYHVSLLPEYLNSTDRLFVKTMQSDYVVPELDNIGMQEVRQAEFFGYVNPSSPSYSAIMGYVPRYSEYKSKFDRITGAFQDEYKNWVSPIDVSTDNYKPDKDTFKQRSYSLDNVFQVSTYNNFTYESDQFLVNVQFNINAVRNISRDGLPY